MYVLLLREVCRATPTANILPRIVSNAHARNAKQWMHMYRILYRCSKIGWLSPPKLTLRGQAGSTYTRIRIQRQPALPG